MALFKPAERKFAGHVSELTYCNPFVPQRIEYERAALGGAFTPSPRVWSLRADEIHERPNIVAIVERVEPLAERIREQLANGVRAEHDELLLYEDLVLYLLYQHDRHDLQRTIAEALEGTGTARPISYWRRFRNAFERFLHIPGVEFPRHNEPAHVFACFFQIRRAFHHIFSAIIGGSMPAANLRAAVWESIFTHDLSRYYRVLFRHMADYTTLVTGPSGTGKELVARAIGQSRYIPFDAETGRFTEDFAASFHTLNLSALSPTLIESELFGHKRGAFTGAVSDRVGWLEVCQPLGTVFLDEIGEVDRSIQVKLLRVLQTRTFQRLGETKDRHFHGKIIAATNRDLHREIAEGRFRTDFYYRLCSDIISTPTLREQLADDPADFENLVLYITKGMLDEGAEAFANDVTSWTEDNLGRDYEWPGNIRELEQCIRNLLIRRTYQPRRESEFAESKDAVGELVSSIKAGRLNADELLRGYCTIVYARTGSYEQAARVLELDRRTVRSRIDEKLLAALSDHRA